MLPYSSHLLHKVMSQEGGSNFDGMGETYHALWKGHLTKADKRRIRLDCYIPKLVKHCFDEAKQGIVVCTDSHEVCLYETIFWVGFRLPFLPIVRERLHRLGLASYQIAPNA